MNQKTGGGVIAVNSERRRLVPQTRVGERAPLSDPGVALASHQHQIWGLLCPAPHPRAHAFPGPCQAESNA